MKFVRIAGWNVERDLHRDVRITLDFLNEVYDSRYNTVTASENRKRSVLSSLDSHVGKIVTARMRKIAGELDSLKRQFERSYTQIVSQPMTSPQDKAQVQSQIYQLYKQYRGFIFMYLEEKVAPLLINRLRSSSGVPLEDAENIVGDAIARFMDPTLNANVNEADAIEGETEGKKPLLVDGEPIRNGGNAASALLNFDTGVTDPGRILDYVSGGLNNSIRSQYNVFKGKNNKNTMSLDDEGGDQGDTIGDIIADDRQSSDADRDPELLTNSLIETYKEALSDLAYSIEELDPMSAERAKLEQRHEMLEEHVKPILKAMRLLCKSMRALKSEYIKNAQPEILDSFAQVKNQFSNEYQKLESIWHSQAESVSSKPDNSDPKMTVGRERVLNWLKNNRTMKDNGMPLIPWSANIGQPDHADVVAYGFTEEELGLTSPTELEEPIAPILKNDTKINNNSNDFIAQKAAHSQMDKRTDAVMPYFVQSMVLPASSKQHLVGLVSNLIKLPSWTYEGINTPDHIDYMKTDEPDLSNLDLNLLWSWLAAQSAHRANNTFVYDTRNRMNKPADADLTQLGVGQTRSDRFDNYVRNSKIYKASPEFFEEKLNNLKGISKEQFLMKMDAGLRAASFERGRMEVAGGKPWSQLNDEELDQIANQTWKDFYKDGNRQFVTVNIKNEKNGPIAPLSDRTDPSNYLRRIRAELDRIRSGDKSWVSTSSNADRKNTRDTSQTEVSREIGDHTGDFSWIKTNLWDQSSNDPNANQNPPEMAVSPQPAAPDLGRTLNEIENIDLLDRSKIQAMPIGSLVRMANIYDAIGDEAKASICDQELHRRALIAVSKNHE